MPFNIAHGLFGLRGGNKRQDVQSKSKSPMNKINTNQVIVISQYYKLS